MPKPLSGSARKRILVLVDLGLTVAAVLLAAIVKFAPTAPPLGMILPRILLISVVLQLSFYYNNLYDLKATHRFIPLTYNLVHSFAVAAMILGVTYLLFPALIIAEGVFFRSIAFVVVFVFPWRYFYIRALRHRGIAENVLIVGTGDVASEIGRKVLQNANAGYNLIGFWTTNGQMPAISEPVPVVSGISGELFQWMGAKRVNSIVVACRKDEEIGSERFLNEVNRRNGDAQIRQGNEFYEEVAGKLLLSALSFADAKKLSNGRKTRIARHFKRLMDIVISVVGLLVTSPISLLTAIAIKLTSRGPVLFAQERVGHNRKRFRLLKFRSMWHNAEAESGPVYADINDDRITPVGRIIRKLRIDEIPQMVNVLRGQMSFVGPRPERPCFVEMLEKNIPYYDHRHCVKPGITGLAQVRHYYTSSTEETVGKLEYDLYYIKHSSPLLDFMILVDTVKTVMFRAGAR
jgi:exopolysaccharide biosynthesis polyprenyl glycosylphosphotransferase